MDDKEMEKVKKAIDYEERSRCMKERICYYCKKKLKNPIKGSYFCDCKDWPKGMYLGIL